MPLKLKIGGGGGGGGGGQQPPTPSGDAAAPKPSGGLKIKISNSQPPTPATEQASASMAPPLGEKKKRVYHRKDKEPSKKRPADDNTLNPAAKRIASDANVAEQRRSSLIKLKSTLPSAASQPSATPSSAGPRLKINKRPAPGPTLTRLNVKGRVPDRTPGNGYDSEDSERERDPATEQQLILRMQPGEDCDYLREAIAEKRVGVPKNEGGAEVSIRFLDRDFRRCVVGIRGRMYAAALVDMPCIVETMKSWDKKGWWKVTDIHQMLLVLGRCSSDEEAKTMALPPRVVDPTTMQYAHGLTPPMHHVRKRRFRKRLSYKDTANVEEEVQRLLEDDDAAEAEGGEVVMEIHNRDSLERSLEPPEVYYDDDADADADADGEAVSTIEDDYNLEAQLAAEMDVDDVAAQMNAAFDEDAAEADGPQQAVTTDPITDSPAALADTAASYAQTHTLPSDMTPADTPAQTPVAQPTSDEDESDYDDDDDDDDGMDVVDEDAAARAAERAQHMEEVKDLEREVEIQRQKLAGQRNHLLKSKLAGQLRSLEEDLRIKKAGLGLEDEG